MKYKFNIVTMVAAILMISGVPGVARAAADTTPPPTPTGFTLTQRSGANLRFGWNWTTDNGAYVPKYELTYAGRTVAVDHHYPSHSQNVADLNLQPGNTYTFELRAVDSAGNKSIQPARLVFETTAPGAASGLTVLSQRGGQPDVIGFNVAPDNSGQIINYEVFLNGESLGLVGRGGSQFSLFEQIHYLACVDAPSGPATVQVRAIDSSFNPSSQLSAPLTVLFP